MANIETKLTKPNNKNTERKPIGSISKPPNNGPATKPNSSTPARRPRRSPRRSGSTWEMSARTAGKTNPNDEPITARANTNCGRPVPKAMSSEPNAPSNMPPMIKRLVWPRSANGETNNCTRKPVRKPEPAISPRPESGNP